MFFPPRKGDDNPKERDETTHRESGWTRFVSVCRAGFAALFLGSLLVSGIGWFTGTPGFPIWPWRNMWFIFHAAYPHGTDTRVYLVLSDEREKEVNMNQWFKYELAPGLNRYSEVARNKKTATELGVFVAKKYFQATKTHGQVKSAKVVYRWWPITHGRRPTEADRAKGDMHIYKVAIDMKGN